MRPSVLWATDLSAPYLHHIDDTHTLTAKLPFDALGMPPDLVRPALAHLDKSPLARLFSTHLAGGAAGRRPGRPRGRSLPRHGDGGAGAGARGERGRRTAGTGRESWTTCSSNASRHSSCSTSATRISTPRPSRRRTSSRCVSCTSSAPGPTCGSSSGSSRSAWRERPRSWRAARSSSVHHQRRGLQVRLLECLPLRHSVPTGVRRLAEGLAGAQPTEPATWRGSAGDVVRPARLRRVRSVGLARVRARRTGTHCPRRP